MHSPEGRKYVYPFDFEAFWRQGNKSLVVYHHMDRTTTPQSLASCVDDRLGLADGSKTITLRLHRGTTPVFFVIPHPGHVPWLEDRIGRFLRGPWGENKHFSRVER